MLCKRCGNPLTGNKQISYCSRRCSKLHLKKLSRQKHMAEFVRYKKLWRRKKRIRELAKELQLVVNKMKRFS